MIENHNLKHLQSIAQQTVGKSQHHHFTSCCWSLRILNLVTIIKQVKVYILLLYDINQNFG